MKIRLHHPLWTHLPAAAVLIFFIIRLVVDSPLPASAPVHYDLNGTPDEFGSPWRSLGITLALSLLFIGLTFILDENWVRQEKRRTFNWMSLLDEIVVGLLVAISVGYMDSLQKNSGVFLFPVSYVAWLAGGATLLAIILELVRPFHPFPGQLVVEDASALTAELTARLKDHRSFIYWESQNPFYFNLLSLLVPALMLLGALVSVTSNPWTAILLFALGCIFLLFYGGMRTTVLPGEITVRFGWTGFKALNIKTADITQAEVTHFSPLIDFGGYGLRVSRDRKTLVKAYYLKGYHGVKITTRDGKRYLIGSDKPEQLLAVIKALAGV